GDPAIGIQPEGWFRLSVSDVSPEQAETRAAAEKMVPKIREALAKMPERTARSKKQLTEAVRGNANAISAALALMEERGEVSVKRVNSADAVTLAGEET